MADKPAPTLEEGITGPRVPAGFSGIRPWVMGYKPLALVLLLGGGVYFFTHPLTMHSAAQAGTMNGKVSPVDAGARRAAARNACAASAPGAANTSARRGERRRSRGCAACRGRYGAAGCGCRG